MSDETEATKEVGSEDATQTSEETHPEISDVKPGRPRAQRNCNPGNLRPIDGQLWRGQTGIDDLEGGPFAIFDSERNGWRALCLNLCMYYSHHGLDTLPAIVHRWAPSRDRNDEHAYVQALVNSTGFAWDQHLNLLDPSELVPLARAISIVESGRGAWWNADDITRGAFDALETMGVVPPSEVA